MQAVPLARENADRHVGSAVSANEFDVVTMDDGLFFVGEHEEQRLWIVDDALAQIELAFVRTVLDADPDQWLDRHVLQRVNLGCNLDIRKILILFDHLPLAVGTVEIENRIELLVPVCGPAGAATPWTNQRIDRHDARDTHLQARENRNRAAPRVTDQGVDSTRDRVLDFDAIADDALECHRTLDRG